MGGGSSKSTQQLVKANNDQRMILEQKRAGNNAVRAGLLSQLLLLQQQDDEIQKQLSILTSEETLLIRNNFSTATAANTSTGNALGISPMGLSQSIPQGYGGNTHNNYIHTSSSSGASHPSHHSHSHNASNSTSNYSSGSGSGRNNAHHNGGTRPSSQYADANNISATVSGTLTYGPGRGTSSNNGKGYGTGGSSSSSGGGFWPSWGSSAAVRPPSPPPPLTTLISVKGTSDSTTQQSIAHILSRINGVLRADGVGHVRSLLNETSIPFNIEDTLPSHHATATVAILFWRHVGTRCMAENIAKLLANIAGGPMNRRTAVVILFSVRFPTAAGTTLDVDGTVSGAGLVCSIEQDDGGHVRDTPENTAQIASLAKYFT